MQSGVVFNVQRYSIQDGPGIRTTVFLKGCPLRCWWCHNPESQSPLPEVGVVADRCLHCGSCRQACPHGVAREGTVPDGARCQRCGSCVAACPTGCRQMLGRRMTVAEVLAEVEKDRLFYEDSGGGITISGGEPLLQAEFTREILKACRSRGLHTAVDTSGYAPWDQLAALAPLVDLFLYDLKLIDDERHRAATGVSNRRILENLQALGRVHHGIWIRVPIIPGFNDSPGDLDAAARFAVSVEGRPQVHLLPYHATGVGKLARLGRPPAHEAVTPPSVEAMQQVASRFRASGVARVSVA